MGDCSDSLVCNAAMLTVEDPDFWEGVEPVKFGVLPRLQDSVTVIGYVNKLTVILCGSVAV